MEFPSLGFVQALQTSLNANSKFNTASRWSDVKVVLGFGDKRYWVKLYSGEIIDVMEYFPMANPLGWDYSISASLEVWQALGDGSRAQGHLLDSGAITVDGDLIQANRLYEATHLMVMAIRELLGGK
ncbi:MAG: hypothetical protein AAF384_07225 [Pseudomonadota bacterium]